MIDSVLVKKGYPLNLYHKRFERKFEFAPGLNILYGGNGCGKSTVLKIIAAHCSIEKCGWTSVIDPLQFKKINTGSILDYNAIGPKGCESIVEWCGTPTLFHNPDQTDKEIFHFTDSGSDGMTNMEEQVLGIFKKESSGEKRISKLMKYCQSIKSLPKFKVRKNFNDVWQKSDKMQIDYFNSLPKTNVVTFMLDEPDRSLSLFAQCAFWNEIVPKIVSTGCQIIIASHSIFCLKQKANIIEFEDGVIKETIKLLKENLKL